MGGVAGHMAHLSEDLDLTFSEIIDILGKVANAEIDNATEKVDGQNLFLTVGPTGEIRTARNNTDIKNGGMSTDEYISKWAGHPAENAFTNGFKAVSAALHKLSGEELEAIFADGQRYVNMEIMYPKNPNIILKNAYLPDEDVKYYFSAADLCVLPYKKGTQSGVQAIADSFSVPVLVSKNGGLHENLDDGKNGFVLNDLHVENLAQKIQDIFSGGKIDIVRNRLNSIQTQKENEWEKFTEDLLEFIKTEKEKIKI